MEIGNADTPEQVEWNLNYEQALISHAAYHEDKRMVFSSAMDMALEAIRTAALINGGAVVAVFALFGAMSDANDAASIAMRLAIIHPSFLFAIGAVLSGIASGLSYFAQIAFARAHEEYELTYKFPYIFDTPAAKRFRIVGELFRAAAVIAVIASYSALGTGLYWGYSAFNAWSA